MLAKKNISGMVMAVAALAVLFSGYVAAGERGGKNRGKKSGNQKVGVIVKGRTPVQPNSRVLAPRTVQSKRTATVARRGHSTRDRHDDGRLRLSVRRPAALKRWVSGHYETREETVLICEGRYEERLVHPARTIVYYDDLGRKHTIEEPAECETVWVAPVYETRTVRVWVPGYWVETECGVGLSASFSWEW